MISVLQTGHFRERFLKTPAYWVGVILLIAMMMLVSFRWNAGNIDRHAYEMGVLRARLVFNMIQTTRSWIAGHGGVFASDSPELASLLQREGNLNIRMTSLKPINPDNAAEPWQVKVLHRFEAGEREAVIVDGRQFHFMGALKVTQTCLQCHAHQGYRLGDIRGGIVVTQSVASINQVVEPQHRTNLMVHVSAFALMTVLLWFSLATIRRHVLQLETERDARRQTAEMLAEKMNQLEAAQNELVQNEKMASLGRMVAGFAHEVNTPVGVAVGAVSHALEALTRSEKLLDDEEVSEADLRAGLATMAEASSLALSNLQRAADMVASFKRTSVDQVSDQIREIHVAQLIDDVFRGQRNIFKRTRIELISDCPDNLIMTGPAGALAQVLNNLVINSFLHAFNEGERAGAIRIAASLTEDQRLRIEYRDDGIGMDEQTLGHVFEPFFTTRRGKGGSGLGMYIVYNLVTRVLRGSIQCTSQIEKGLQCTIVMPTVVDSNHASV